jgi:ATP-dependent helicase/DNAse subunit B
VPLTLVTGPANSAKAQVVLDGYRAALARSPILVVPRAADAEHYRRELADGGAVLGVRVEPFSTLMREIALRAGIVARPLGDHARNAVIASVVNTTPLVALADAAQGPAFIDSLTRFIAQLQARRITPPRFTAALRSWAADGTSRRVYAEELAGLYSGYRRRLERLGRLDRELHDLQALDELSLAPDRWGQTPVFCYGFDDLDALQLDAIETLAHKVDAPVTLSLPGEPGRVAFAGRAATLETLRPGADAVLELEAQPEYYEELALFHLERSLFESAEPTPPGLAVGLIEGGDERAEAELVAAEIATLIAAGISAGDIAIVTRTSAPGELLAETLAAFGVPHARNRRGPLSSSSVGRGILAMLRCAGGAGDAVDLVSWLGVPGVVRLELALETFEARMREAGITSLSAAREQWEREHGTLHGLIALERAARSGATALLDAIDHEFEGLLAASAEREAALLDPWEAAAVAAGRRALNELRELAHTAERLIGGIAGVTRALEAVTVELAASNDGEAVLIGDALSLRARRVRALFICATQEGTFPAPAAEELFLGTSERGQLAHASGLILANPTDSLAAERSLFYALCSRPTARLRVSWHVATDDGEAALASLFIDELRDCFEGSLYDARRTRIAGAIAWPDHSIDSPATRRLEATLAAPRRRGAVIAPLEHPERLVALRGHEAHSPSALERWAACPVAWFVERGLGVGELTPDQVWLTRGSAVHEHLATVFTQLREQTPAGRLDSSTLAFALDLLDAELAKDAPLSPNREVDLTEGYRMRHSLRRYLVFAAASGSTHDPWQLELAFGTDGAPHPAVVLADGALALCGRVDRVDLDPADRTIIVYDYKSGRTGVTAAAKWTSEGCFQPALYMRAMESLLDVEAVAGLYQPLRGKSLQPRGAVSAEADPDADLAKNDRISDDEFKALVDGQIAAALQAARELDRGALDPRPATCAYPSGCQFPTICRCEAR